MKKQTVSLESFVEVAGLNKELTDENVKLLQRAKDAEEYVMALQDKMDSMQKAAIKGREQIKELVEGKEDLAKANSKLRGRISGLEARIDAPKPASELELLIGRLVKDEVDSIVEKGRQEHRERMEHKRRMRNDIGRRDRQW